MVNRIDELSTSSSNASKNIDQLTKSLQGLNDMSKPLIEAINNINQPMETLSSGFDIMGLLNTFSSIKGAIFDIFDVFDTLSGAGQTTSSTLVSAFSTASAFLTTSISSVSSSTATLGASAASLTTALTTTSTTTGFLGTAMSFLAANPITAVVGGIGLAIGALAIFGGSIDMSSKKTQENIKILEEKKNGLDKVTESLKQNSQATKDNVEGIQADFAATLSYVDELEGMSANGGLAGNMEKAKYLVDEINKVLPNSVSITENGTLAWKGSAEEIKKNLELLEKKAIVEAHQAEYVEAMKTRNKLQAELTASTNAYNEAKERELAKKKQIEEAIENGEGTNKLVSEYQDLISETHKYKDVLDSSKSAMAANDESVNNYKTSLEALDGTVESNAKAMVESYGTVSNDGLHTYDSLAKGLMDLNQKELLYNENKIKMSETEIATNKKAREMVIEELTKKAEGFGDSYDKMVETLEERGVYLTDLEKKQLENRFKNQEESNKAKEELTNSNFETVISQLEANGITLTEKEKEQLGLQYLNWEENAKGKEGIQALSYENLIAKLEESGRTLTDDEKAQLKEQYNAWQQNASDKETTLSTNYSNMKEKLNSLMSGMNEDQKTKLNESVRLFSESGNTGGLELCGKLASALNKSNGQVTGEVQGILDEIDTMAKNANPTAEIEVDKPTDAELEGANKSIQGKITGKNFLIDFFTSGNGFKIGPFTFPFNFYASGGFPDTGELFVAREAGPELVGRINGKTAVANNNQIVSGISAGVYNAVTSAMSGVGNKGNININAIFTMDGEVVGKQVIKYHNGVVRRTGKTPLIV